MKQNIKKSLIKASGGIKDITAAKKMINAGASRLGLSSLSRCGLAVTNAE